MDPQISPKVTFDNEPDYISQSSTQEAPVQPAPARGKNKLYLWLIFLIILVALAGAGYFLVKSSGEPPKETQITGLEVAKKTALFLDKTLEKRGGMSAGFNCAVSNECIPLEKIEGQPPHLGQAIYGYYSLATASDDNFYRLKADRVMNFVLDECQTNVEMCSWNFFPLSRYYFDTKENKYLQGMLKPAPQFLEMSNLDIIQQNVGHKLASLYLATGDERYKKRLLEVADEELPITVSEDKKNEAYYRYAIQVIWSIFLPAYNLTKDDKYLAASEQFFDNFDLEINFNQLKNTQTIIKEADALLILAGISDNRSVVYKAKAHVLLQQIIDKLWDYSESPKINGDYGFLDFLPSEEGSRSKLTLNNGWLVKLFVIMADEKFNLPVNNEQTI